jgi:hypothetical protein
LPPGSRVEDDAAAAAAVDDVDDDECACCCGSSPCRLGLLLTCLDDLMRRDDGDDA